MPEASHAKIGDYVYAELVDCTPADAHDVGAETAALMAQQAPEGHSPTRIAQMATVAQTGNDPPPVVQDASPACTTTHHNSQA